MTHDRAAKPTIRETVYNWADNKQPGTTSIHDLDALVSALEYREMQRAPREPHKELIARITGYLVSGGLFNPEMAIHERVRDLLIDCRDALIADQTPRASSEAQCNCNPIHQFGCPMLAQTTPPPSEGRK